MLLGLEWIMETLVDIEAPQEVVYNYFVEPGRMTAWMGMTTEVEPEPNGIMRLVISEKDVPSGGTSSCARSAP